jgi:GNAT superfamily N-acetyltransferase
MMTEKGAGGLSIRACRREDIEVVLELWRQAEATPRRSTAGGVTYRLAVHPAYRRQGVARALVAEVERWLAEQGARRITALVEKEHPWAMNFWEAVGYRVDERVVRRVRNL